MTLKKDLLKQAKLLPKSAGCYLMKNKYQDVIYVGKAKNLKNRVSTYFDNSQKYIKTQALVRNIQSFEFIMTSTEIESLILENNLIKKFNPKYNIRLRDDKTYPYVQINYNEDFPELVYTRKPKNKKNYKHFGPFPEGTHLKSTLKALTKTFKLRDCSLTEFRSRKTPCLIFEMNQCNAPCVQKISIESYQETISKAQSFFESPNKRKNIIKELKDKMNKYSKNEQFENAILLRDSISTLEIHDEASHKQQVELNKGPKDIDLFAYFYHKDEIDLCFYEIRNSLLIGTKNLNFINSFQDEEDFQKELPSVILSYYSEKFNLPKFFYSNLSEKNLRILNELFSNKFTNNLTAAKVPRKFNELQKTTKDFAENAQRMRKDNYQNILKGLKKLQDLLKLEEMPRDLECYDVAIWQGQSPTASQITFKDGKKDSKNYRLYHLKERPEGNNDFAMMEEVLERRLKQTLLPDVFVVDGGKLQMKSFQKILRKHKIDIPVVGIAKSRLHPTYKNDLMNKSEERLFIPGRTNPYTLKKNIELFRILTQMRDEAHRFSRKLHHKEEKKKFIHSDLSKIPGVGKVTIQKILSKHNGKIEELAKLEIKEFWDLFSVNKSTAQKIIEYLKKIKA